MILNIVTLPEPSLHEKSKSVPAEQIKDSEFQTLLEDMAETMYKKDGIGLAAPQIGRNLRVVIVATKDGPLTLINPEIISKSWRQSVQEEGCLSVPETFVNVKRHNSIKVKALDKQGKETEFKAKGMFARVIQHELDHLDGILIVDKK